MSENNNNNNSNNNNDGNKIALKTISLLDLWNVLRGCFIFVIIAAVLVTTVVYFNAKSKHVPMYSSTATIYLIGVYEGDFNVDEFANDYNVAYRVIDECSYLLKSRRVMSAVSDDLKATTGDGTVGAITIDVPKDTRIINITATANSPQRAKQVVDSVCKCGAEEMKNWLAYDQFRVFQEGTLNYWPINNINIFTFAKFGIIAGGLVYIIFLAIFLFDNYIRTEEDIEMYLGLTILGDIPDADAPDKYKKKYSNYKGHQSNGYGYGSRYASKEESDK